jgi:hypothetical protein
MNRIEVIGGKPYQRKYVQSIAEFCIETLMPRMCSLDITIKLTTLKGVMGFCQELDTNREFELEIDRKLTLRKMLETVAHEMVHVKQYARRELRHNYKWCGKTYSPGLFVRWCELHKHRANWTQLD